jgi:hypothetical protein
MTRRRLSFFQTSTWARPMLSGLLSLSVLAAVLAEPT